MAEPKKTSFLQGLLLGVGASALVLSVGSMAYVKSEGRRVRAGWNLVPAVVMAEDAAAGTVITFEMINQRSVPEQFMTASVVMPMDAHQVVGQRLALPVKQGDLLLHEFIWRGSEQDLTACRQLNTPASSQEASQEAPEAPAAPAPEP